MAKVREINAYLIYRAHDESLRVAKGTNGLRLAWDEIAFTIKVNVPDPWGKLAGAVLIDLPETGPAVVEVTHTEDHDA